MKRQFARPLGVLAFGVTALLLAIFRFPPLGSTTEQKLRSCYEELRLALVSGDPARAASVLPPGFRGDVHFSLNRVAGFARPLTAASKFAGSGDAVDVCPEPRSYYLVVPGGHTLEMVRSGERWYFSGEVHVD